MCPGRRLSSRLRHQLNASSWFLGHQSSTAQWKLAEQFLLNSSVFMRFPLFFPFICVRGVVFLHLGVFRCVLRFRSSGTFSNACEIQELYPLLQLLDPNIADKREFALRYFGGVNHDFGKTKLGKIWKHLCHVKLSSCWVVVAAISVPPGNMLIHGESRNSTHTFSRLLGSGERRRRSYLSCLVKSNKHFGIPNLMCSRALISHW